MRRVDAPWVRGDKTMCSPFGRTYWIRDRRWHGHTLAADEYVISADEKSQDGSARTALGVGSVGT